MSLLDARKCGRGRGKTVVPAGGGAEVPQREIPKQVAGKGRSYALMQYCACIKHSIEWIDSMQEEVQRVYKEYIEESLFGTGAVLLLKLWIWIRYIFTTPSACQYLQDYPDL